MFYKHFLFCIGERQPFEILPMALSWMGTAIANFITQFFLLLDADISLKFYNGFGLGCSD
jgi:hypothetical protein